MLKAIEDEKLSNAREQPPPPIIYPKNYNTNMLLDWPAEEIARQIIVELEPALTKAEFSSVRRKRTDNVDAWTHFRQAIGAIAVQGWNEESVAEALTQLKQAVAIDPEFAVGRALLSLVSGFGASLSLVSDIDAAVKPRAKKPSVR